MDKLPLDEITLPSSTRTRELLHQYVARFGSIHQGAHKTATMLTVNRFRHLGAAAEQALKTGVPLSDDDWWRAALGTHISEPMPAQTDAEMWVQIGRAHV